MPGTLSEALDNLYTSTWRGMREGVADQIFDSTPFFFWLKKNDKLETQAGGRTIDRSLEFADGNQSVWLTKGESVSLNDVEILSTATFDWRYLASPVTRFWQDDQKNRGKHQIVNLMRAKLGNAQKSIESKLETQLASTSGSSTNAFDGLQHLVADDPTSALTVGGISQATYSWWQNKATNMTGESFATYGLDRMETLVNTIGNNKKREAPDIIVSGQTPFEYYKSTGLGYSQAYFKELLDMGFENIAFRGIPMTWTPSIANTRMYFLNTNHLTLVYDPAYYFDMSEWMPVPTQVNDRVAHIALACATVTDGRRFHGVIHTIDTP